MNHSYLRFVPANVERDGPLYVLKSGIRDRRTGRIHFRPEYTAVERQEICAWLNDRELGYSARVGAVKHVQEVIK